MPRRGSIVKRQRPAIVKERHLAVLKNEKKNSSKDIISVAVSVGERELKFARALADTEERVRSASLTSLRAWLEENGDNLDSAEIDKLWKALFYCIWMADKRHIISTVIRDIVSLFDVLGWPHLRGLFRCMVREWMGVDRHRVDKFYELLNVALEKGVVPVLTASTEAEMKVKIGDIVSCICDELIQNACKEGKGILMHVLDKWANVVLRPILEKASSFSANTVHWAWDNLLEKFFPMLKSADGRLRVVKRRLEEQVLQELPNLVLLETVKVPIRAKHDMLVRVSKSVFAAASDAGISEEDRRRLYEMRTNIKIVIVRLKSEMNIPVAKNGNEPHRQVPEKEMEHFVRHSTGLPEATPETSTRVNTVERPQSEGSYACLKSGKANCAKDITRLAVSIDERELKFARALTDTEERVRSASLTSLRAWLKENGDNLDSAEIDKLWKALFYCIWMADKRHIISAVIRDIVSLFDVLGWPHLRGLFRCMVREWMGVDRHRVDKFYELLNVALEKGVVPVRTASTEAEMKVKVGDIVSCICDELIQNACKEGKGILMHVLDKWANVVLRPILEKASSFSANTVHWAWDNLLEKFFPMLKSADGRLRVVKRRLEEQVLQELPNLVLLETVKVPIRAKHDMLVRVSKSVFAAASDAGISEEDRRRLYEMRTNIKTVILQLKSEMDNPATAGKTK